MSVAVVYRMLADDGDLLYIGCSTRGLVRWNEHLRDSAWWPDVRHISVTHYPSQAEAFVAEQKAIRYECPRWNWPTRRG